MSRSGKAATRLDWKTAALIWTLIGSIEIVRGQELDELRLEYQVKAGPLIKPLVEYQQKYEDGLRKLLALKAITPARKQQLRDELAGFRLGIHAEPTFPQLRIPQANYRAGVVQRREEVRSNWEPLLIEYRRKLHQHWLKKQGDRAVEAELNRINGELDRLLTIRRGTIRTGRVSLFGLDAYAADVVFALDFSLSMETEGRIITLKAEATKTLHAIPSGVRYQVILFAGPAWYLGDQVYPKTRGDPEYETITFRGRSGYEVWYCGWDPSERVRRGTQKEAVFHHEGGAGRLPASTFHQGRLGRRETMLLEETPLQWGTDWRWPLIMAANLHPDVIFFLTDGANDRMASAINDLLKHNQSHGGAIIHTVGIGQELEELKTLAAKTGGLSRFVKANGNPLR